jgi:hypothetical protein
MGVVRQSIGGRRVRPQFGSVLMRHALLPAIEAKQNEVIERLDQMLDRIGTTPASRKGREVNDTKIKLHDGIEFDLPDLADCTLDELFRDAGRARDAARRGAGEARREGRPDVRRRAVRRVEAVDPTVTPDDVRGLKLSQIRRVGT